MARQIARQVRSDHADATSWRAVQSRSDADYRQRSRQKCRSNRATGRGRGGQPPGAVANFQEFQKKRAEFFAEEGVAALIDPSTIGDGGTFFVQARRDIHAIPRAPKWFRDRAGDRALRTHRPDTGEASACHPPDGYRQQVL